VSAKTVAAAAEKPAWVSLKSLEEEYAALLDTQDMVPAEQQQEFDNALRASLEKNQPKRDSVYRCMKYCEMQAREAEEESRRLKARQKFFESAKERMRGYVRYVIESLGPDHTGKYRKLEGTLVTFGLRDQGFEVDVQDEQAVPNQYKRATITMRADHWKQLLEENAWLQIDGVCNTSFEVMKSWIKPDLGPGKTVPGASLKPVQVLEVR
jgi:hypothetical protein